MAGVSNPYLSQIERGLRKPSAEVLQQLAKGLRISAEALYVRAGILDGEQGFDVHIAVHADPQLSERQKRVLLDLYTAFLEEGERSPTAEKAEAAGETAAGTAPAAEHPGAAEAAHTTQTPQTEETGQPA